MENSTVGAGSPYNYQQINSTLDEIHELFEQKHEIDPKHYHMPDGGYYNSLISKVIFRRSAQAQKMFRVIRSSLSNSNTVDFLDVINAHNADSDDVYEIIRSTEGGLVTLNKEFKNRLLVDVLCVEVNALYPAIIARQAKLFSNEYVGGFLDYGIFNDYQAIFKFFMSERKVKGLKAKNYVLLKAIVNCFFGYYVHRMPLPKQLQSHTIIAEARKLMTLLATQFRHVIAIETDLIYCWDSSGEGFNRCLDIINSEYENISIHKEGVIPYAIWSNKKKKQFMLEKPLMFGFGRRPIINGEEQIIRGENIPFSNPPLSEWLKG